MVSAGPLFSSFLWDPRSRVEGHHLQPSSTPGPPQQPSPPRSSLPSGRASLLLFHPWSKVESHHPLTLNPPLLFLFYATPGPPNKVKTQPPTLLYSRLPTEESPTLQLYSTPRVLEKEECFYEGCSNSEVIQQLVTKDIQK